MNDWQIDRFLILLERYVVVQEGNYALSRDRVQHLKDVETRNAKSGEDMAKMNFKATVEHTNGAPNLTEASERTPAKPG